MIKSRSTFGQKTISTGPRTSLESLEIQNGLFYGFGDTRRPDSRAVGYWVMVDKILIITAYAIPTIGLLIVCFLISRKK